MTKFTAGQLHLKGVIKSILHHSLVNHFSLQKAEKAVIILTQAIMNLNETDHTGVKGERYKCVDARLCF